MLLLLIVLVAVLVCNVESFSAAALLPPTRRDTNKRKGTLLSAGFMSDDQERTKDSIHSRRSLLNTLGTQSVVAAMLSQTCFASPAIAAESSSSAARLK